MNHPSYQSDTAFSEEERRGLYKTIFTRRDVRGQFKPDPIPPEVLSRILLAAHHAPSVGFMQPWNFIVVTSPETRRLIHAAFLEAHAEAALMFTGEKRETYKSLKLEGIMESPVNVCVTCDRSRSGPLVIGRTAIKTMDLFSSVCAVQNLWLAARAEGLGVGWVSIIHQEALQKILGIPRKIIPVAYLCMGSVTHFHKEPELQTAGWLPRLPLDELLYFDRWGSRDAEGAAPLLQQVRQDLRTPPPSAP
ncbi:MAG: 5,6-dimethylbenzimidazole synthase [Planctomycetota bacterium]